MNHSLDNLKQQLNQQPLSVLYISMPNCSVCHAVEPKVEKLISTLPSIKMTSIDASQIPDIAGEYSIFTAPVVLLFSYGKELYRQARFIQMDELEHQLKKYHEFIF